MVVSVGKMPPEDLIHEVDIPLYPVPSVVHHRELQRLSEYLGLLGRNWCTPHTSAIWLPHIRVALHDLRSAVYLRVLASVGSLGGWYFPDDIEGRHRDEVVQVCKEMVRNGDLIGTRSWPESGPRAFGYALSRPILRLV